MQPEDSQRGRTLLVAVTLVALALQAIKLGARVMILHRWPTAAQWGQLALVVWMVMSLWEGHNWARIATALYYTLAAAVGVVMLLVMWPEANTSLRVVSILIVLLAGGVSIVLWLSPALRLHLAERRSA